MATIPTIELADIECPESVARAMTIDAETGTAHWQDAISMERKALKFQLVFYVKPDTLQPKVRLVMDDDNKRDGDTPITTNAIHTGSEVPRLAAEAHLPSTKAMAGSKKKSKKEKEQQPKPKPNKGKVPKKQKPKKEKKPTKKGKKNKGKFPKKAKCFSRDNPGAYVTAVWKSMSKEEQQAARASRHEQGIPTRSNNTPRPQFPSFETPEVDNDPHPLEATVVTKEDPIAYPLELQKMQIMEPKRKTQEFQTHLLRPPKAVQPWSLI
jgi:hypothetical protein